MLQRLSLTPSRYFALVPGLAALVALLAVIVTAFSGLLLAAGPAAVDIPWRYILGVAFFSLWQAALSTVLSLLAGAALALALSRRRVFWGRRVLLAIFNVAAVLPAIVVVFGIVSVYGRSGWLGNLMHGLGLPYRSWFYGLPGILLAHVFFNMPLALRVFLAALGNVPQEYWRLGTHLGMGPLAVFRLIDGPVLLKEVPGVAALVFSLCFTSFSIVLTLGGGPATATLEVAIYEAIRFDAGFAGSDLSVRDLSVDAVCSAHAGWHAHRFHCLAPRCRNYRHQDP